MTDNKHACPNCEALKAKVEYLTSQLVSWDDNFYLKASLPNEEEAAVLFTRITTRFPQMRSQSDSERDQVQGLIAAMGYCFSVAKTQTPTTRYDGSWWTGEALRWANKVRMPCSRVRSVLAGIIACNDILYRVKTDELFLDPFGGRGTPVARDRGGFCCRVTRCQSRLRGRRRCSMSRSALFACKARGELVRRLTKLDC